MSSIFSKGAFAFFCILAGSSLFCLSGFGQEPVIDKIVKEETDNSQLQKLAHELFDGIGPRLVGTTQMDKANEWAVAKYASWGITAHNEKWGEWRGWERGISHIDMIYPRIKSLEGTQLAWSPTGRPDYNWQEFATAASFEKMKKERTAQQEAWASRIKKAGYTNRTLPVALEKAGAAGVVINNWSAGFGVDKIFGAFTKKIPTIDIALEDYGLLYRLTESGDKPKISVHTESKERGVVPTFNTIAEIKGSEKPNEYVILSAHFDSWDGGTGATDNGTGTLTMMEAMRILKLAYPNPKRTILVGHWGSEEEGLNGSRAFVEDHPEIVQHIQAGGSDFASFVAMGAPAFSLSSLNWSYGTYTWHTNRDTYDKIVFDDLRNNAILVAALVYMASEDPVTTNREKSVLPINTRTGEQFKWPEPTKSIRKGGLD